MLPSDQPQISVPERPRSLQAANARPAAAPGRFPLIAVVCLGFALRCFWWLKYPVSDSPDALLYLREAENLFSSGTMQSDVCMPLYPILLHLAGADGIILLQLALGTVSIYLAYQLACDIWHSRRAGLVAALMMAVHPMLIYYTTFRLTETVSIFLVLLGFAALYRNQIAGAAVAFVLADLARPSLDLVFPAIIVAATFATIAKPSIREIARRLGIFALIYGALMSPWWLHNYQKYHRFVRLDLGAGITMVLENNEGFERYGLDFSKYAPWAPFANIADPVEKDAAMQSAAIAYIRTHPSAWLRGVIDRTTRFFTPSDLSYTKFQVNFSAIVLVVTLAGALAVLMDYRSWRRTLPLWIAIGFLTALHLSFHALPRYRLPLDPLLIILASGPLYRAIALVKSLQRIHPSEAAYL
jgi:4-amino-4-deoxy-L-arabinose transferase-like glycosyltransferase